MTPTIKRYKKHQQLSQLWTNTMLAALVAFYFTANESACAASHCCSIVHGDNKVFSRMAGFALSRPSTSSSAILAQQKNGQPIQKGRSFHAEFAPLRTTKLLSSIPGDDDDHNNINNNNRKSWDDRVENMFKSMYKKLPPFPENTLILGGDVGWLFFYSILDHVLHDVFVQTTASQEPNIVGIHAAWIDLMHKPAEFMAASSEYGMAAPYSPALASGGICAVLFATLWLVNGYFQQSFSFQNTVTCDSHTAVKVAGKLWFTTAIGMLALAYASDALQLAGLQHQVGGLTQTDLDFILDSLPVMVCWRWMIAWIFNGFK